MILISVFRYITKIFVIFIFIIERVQTLSLGVSIHPYTLYERFTLWCKMPPKTRTCAVCSFSSVLFRVLHSLVQPFFSLGEYVACPDERTQSEVFSSYYPVVYHIHGASCSTHIFSAFRVTEKTEKRIVLSCLSGLLCVLKWYSRIPHLAGRTCVTIAKSLLLIRTFET